MKLTDRLSDNSVLWNICVIFIAKLQACYTLRLVKVLSGKYATRIFSKQIFPDKSGSGRGVFLYLLFISMGCPYPNDNCVFWIRKSYGYVTFSSLTIILNPNSNGCVQVLTYILDHYTVWNITLKPLCIFLCKP
jgi:hypothetical protein